MALGKGFEPLVPVSRDNCLAGSRYQPLSQPNRYKKIDSKKQALCQGVKTLSIV